MARIDAAPAWIEGRGFDAAAFFVPALLGLSAFGAVALAGVPPVILLWVWIAAFDGPHMLAAYSRAYGDPTLWRTRKLLLVGSWGAFLVGPVLLVLGTALGAVWLFSAFLLLMTFYSYHHLVRQHWGFAALYAARSGRSASRTARHALYLGCWCPYLVFLLTHPRLRELAGSALSPDIALLTSSLAGVAFAIWLAVALHSVRLVVRQRRAGRPSQSQAYLVVAVLFHGLAYLGLARAEPLFEAAQNLDQTFMMLAVVNGVFHSAQYVALVALFHVRSTLGGELAPTWFGRSLGRALLVSVPFLALYVALACATGLYPGCAPWFQGTSQASVAVRVGDISLNQWALALWWGFALHHYWLDERIWHVRSDARLRRIFRLEERSTADAAGRAAA